MRVLDQCDRQLGASSVEYAIVISMIALAIIVAVAALGGAVADLYVVF